MTQNTYGGATLVLSGPDYFLSLSVLSVARHNDHGCTVEVRVRADAELVALIGHLLAHPTYQQNNTLVVRGPAFVASSSSSLGHLRGVFADPRSTQDAPVLNLILGEGELTLF